MPAEWSGIPAWHLIGLLAALAIAFGFECVNGFHDAANAVATVIYTRSLPPWVAVIWSGFWNFVGVHVGGIAVAFSIVHLLPADIRTRPARSGSRSWSRRWSASASRRSSSSWRAGW
jgi:PiT family inorganic phosphate transporter